MIIMNDGAFYLLFGALLILLLHFLRSRERRREVSALPEPRIRFLEMGDSALIFRVMVWIDEPVSRGVVLDGLNTAIYKALNAAEIPIPFPQRDVHLFQAMPPAP